MEKQMQTEEIWKDMIGHENLYQISNLGNIYSKLVNRVVKSSYDDKGYKIRTHRANGKVYVTKVHRAVALAFLPNPENKPFVNHKNGIKDDNALTNLEWVTGSENQKHNVSMNPNRRGVGHSSSKLSEEDVKYIRQNPDKLDQSSLARKFGLHQSRISEIKNGRTYKDLPIN